MPWFKDLHLTLKIGPSLPNIRRQKLFTYILCQAQPFAVMSSLTGFSTGVGCRFDHRNFCAKIATSLGGTSTRTMIHTLQRFKIADKLTQYDWSDAENLKRYGTPRPPEYDVSKVRTFTAVYVSDTDEFTPTRTVVPFVQKFNGPTYICRYPNVCHLFTEYDSRVEPYVKDSMEVLDSMTGRTGPTKMLSKTCQIDGEYTDQKHENFISKAKRFIFQLLPGFVAQHL